MGASPFNVGYTPQPSLQGLTITPSASTMTGAPGLASDPSDSDGELSSLLGSASSALPIAGAALSIVTQLFQGHEIRAKDAANENTQMNQIIPYVTQAFLQLVQGMKAGKYTGPQAQGIAANIVASYNSFVKSLQGKPGIADDGGSTCGKTCTAGCCLRTNYVNYLYVAVTGAITGATPNQPVINPNGKQWILGTTGIPANKYGFAGVPAYQVPIVFNPALSVAGINATVENDFAKIIAWIRGIL